MAKSLANVEISTDTFENWITRTNQVVETLRNEIVTANSTSATPPTTTGNAEVVGVFSANTIKATNLLGGNVTANAVLNIQTNTAFTSNITVTSATLAVGDSLANTTHVVGNNVVGVDTMEAQTQLTIATDTVFLGSSNADLGANVTDPQTVFEYAKATYSSAKLVTQVKNGTNTQITELLVAYDDTTNAAVMTSYGAISAPVAANLGVYSVATDATNVVVSFTQTGASSSHKTSAQLIK